MKSYLAGCVLLLFFIQQAAQAQDNYLIQHYTNENGLSANGVKGIELDKKNNFLWVGTQAGLVRFDGINFKHFGSSKGTSIPSRIVFIAKNREGTIYCEEDNFSVHRVANSQAEWVTTDSFFIARFMYRGGSNPVLPVKELVEKLRKSNRSAFLPKWIVFNDEPDDSSSFSVSCFDHIYYYNAAKDSLFDFPHFNDIIKLDGRIYYVGLNLDLWQLDRSTEKLIPAQITGMPEWKKNADEKPKFIWTTGMEEPLFIYRQDIWKLQRTEGKLKLEPLCQQCIPPNANIASVQTWKEKGLLFLGSVTNGLYVIKLPFLRSITASASAKNGSAEYGQVEAIPGVITTASGLTYSANGKLVSGNTTLQFQSGNIYQDQHGDCWFSASDTIVHFYQKNNRYSKIAVNNGASQFVFAATNKRMYVISDKAIAEITNDRYKLLYQLPFTPHALDNTLLPTAAIEWKAGTLAIASKQLLFFDVGKNTKPDTIPIPGLIAQVRSLMKHGDYLLIGTYGQGYYVYKNGIVKKMPLDKSGYLAYAHCFMPDNKGYCWISTNHGLFKASLHALINAYENDLNEIYYHYFGRKDGIFNTEFNGGCQPCALKMSNGSFSFPTMNGMVIFDPLSWHTPPPSGDLYIDEIWIDTLLHEQADSGRFNIHPDVKSLRFKVAMPRFGNSENIYFSYKLEPYSDNWEIQDLMTNDVLQFGGLKPGVYKLYLRVRNGFEPDQFNMKIISFEILKPWYQRWWFYSLCFLAFLAATWLLVQWRTASINKRKKELQHLVALQTRNLQVQSRQLGVQLGQLKKQQQDLEADNQVKARLIGIISHDMLSPLKFMVEVGKKLRDAFEPSDPSHRVAESMVSVTRELESLSINMLNWIRFHHESFNLVPESFDLRQVVGESTEIAGMLAAEKGILFFNQVPENSFICQYRQAIAVIVYNLAMNAMKYTSAGEIRVSAEHSNEHIVICVTDTGSGMPEALVEQLNLADSFYHGGTSWKHQFGYVIIKDLLQLTGGEMKVESTLNKGTKITITLKQVRNRILYDL